MAQTGSVKNPHGEGGHGESEQSGAAGYPARPDRMAAVDIGGAR